MALISTLHLNGRVWIGRFHSCSRNSRVRFSAFLSSGGWWVRGARPATGLLILGRCFAHGSHGSTVWKTSDELACVASGLTGSVLVIHAPVQDLGDFAHDVNRGEPVAGLVPTD